MSEPIIDLASEIGDFLSSRHSAVELRIRVEALAKPVTIDLSGVVSLSDSFADEFFAILVQEHGHDWFARNVSVKGMSQEIRHTVLRAVHLRCERTPEECSA